MCGIVGLLVRNEEMRANIGALMMPMLIGMTERGPDSAGMAVFTSPVAGKALKFSVYAPSMTYQWEHLAQEHHEKFGMPVSVHAQGNHAILTTLIPATEVRAWLKNSYPNLHLLSVGKSIDVYKDTGLPAEVAERYSLPKVTGTHLVGHTRMATESAITPAHAHPFTAGQDW